MHPHFVIDRIEGDIAIVEFGDITFEIPSSVLPEEAKEGSVISLSVHPPEMENQDKEAKERLARLQARDSGDEIIDL